MTSVQISNPSLPFWNAIPGGLSVGKVIRIQGLFPTVFDVWKTILKMQEDYIEAVKSYQSKLFILGNSWQHEERDGPFPFGEGRQFLVQIVVQSYLYEISVNGQHCWTYSHRLPYSGVTHLNIDGPLKICNVEYRGNAQVQMANFQFSPEPPADVRLVNSPSLPYWGNLPQTLAVGNAVEIKGSFPISIDRSRYTAINLCQDSKNTIAFHLSIRFNCNEGIRNSYQHGSWETEEKGGPFPFALGKEFLIKILVQSFDYQISVNGAYSWSFAHRLPFGMVNAVSIEGPVNIRYVNYTSSKQQQKQMPRRPVYSPTASVPVPPQSPPSLHSVYNPAVPFSYHINGGIKVNMMIYISGIPYVNFHNFTISLQCGQQQSCPDVAFHFDVRGYNGTIVRNTRRNNRWEDEETAASYFPFFPSVPFDMIILVQNDKYKVAVQGAHFIEYYHRMTRFSRINTLKIENDVTITSIRFAE